MFTKDFSDYACVGDKIACKFDGFDFVATIVHDDDYRLDDDDCHNPHCASTPDEQEQIAEARRAFFAGEWFYGGIVISASFNGVKIGDHLASLWGIDVNYPNSHRLNPNEYLREIANDILCDALKIAQGAREDMLDKLSAK